MNRHVQQNIAQILIANCLIAQTLLACGSVYADDYALHQKPFYEQGTAHIPEAYKHPEDSRVCGLYLQNLRYFARRNVPMSCERPVAPVLKERIARVEWEDLDPVRYAELFRVLVSKSAFVEPKVLDEPQLDSWRVSVRNGRNVFRRAKLLLRGYPQFEDEYGRPAQEAAFQLIQFGPNVDFNSPDPQLRCKPHRGGFSSYDFPLMYVVTEDLSGLYGGLVSVADGEGYRHLLVMDGRPYIEEVFRDADIRLSEIGGPNTVILEPVCLYHFTMSAD